MESVSRLVSYLATISSRAASDLYGRLLVVSNAPGICHAKYIKCTKLCYVHEQYKHDNSLKNF